MITFFKETRLESELVNLSNWKPNRLKALQQVQEYFLDNFHLENFYTTKSCTQSLELALMSLNRDERFEVILPSYAFVSLANAIVLNGYKCKFVDCVPDTMNIDPSAVEQAITNETAAIITINYGGVACDYDKLIALCDKHSLSLLEDNAHGIRAKYKGKWLGSFGDISTISFDYLKNISCSEGGGISINNKTLLKNFEQAYHFGTNRAAYLRGESSFYEWKGIGCNASLAEQLAVILNCQLLSSETVVSRFQYLWRYYYDSLKELQEEGHISLANIPEYCCSNGHMFWIKASNKLERQDLIQYLAKKGIQTAFHYTALHSSEFGKKTGVFSGEDIYTTKESQRLLRLPLFYTLGENEVDFVVEAVRDFYIRRK